MPHGGDGCRAAPIGLVFEPSRRPPPGIHLGSPLLPCWSIVLATLVGTGATAPGGDIAGEVAEEAEQGRGTLEELIRGCSFAGCNPADVYHLLLADLSLTVLRQMLDGGVISPFPEACLGDRGPYIFEHGAVSKTEGVDPETEAAHEE